MSAIRKAKFKLGDFGLAKKLSTLNQQTRTYAGTLETMGTNN
jgi:hypothetical protein